MNTLDGTSLLELTNNSNVFKPVIFKQILNDDNFLFDSQEDDFFKVILNTDNLEVREVLCNLIQESKFSYRESLRDKGKIIPYKTFWDYIPFFKPKDITDLFTN